MRNEISSSVFRVARASLLTFGLALSSAVPALGADKPNILVIMGDDIGTWNLSYINRGMMGSYG